MSTGTSRKRTHHDIALSSTFRDLKQHRQAVLEAMSKLGLYPQAMENDSARPEDIIESSLSLIRAADAYVGMIGYRYGQIPECPARNPNRVSITELEYEEAEKRGLPICMFVMGETHLVPMGEMTIPDAERQKRKTFCERIAKNHIYAEFESVNDLKEKVIYSLVELRDKLDAAEYPAQEQAIDDPKIPLAPTLFAMPPYTPGHPFMGRAKEIQLLNNWAIISGEPVLVLEAIGGMGKSMICWQWVKYCSQEIRPDFAGIFWYSFYERGADMNDFCTCALAYISGHPVAHFKGRKTGALAYELIQSLRQRSWLLALDGLERVLVAYNRYDAAQLRDEEVESSKGAIYRLREKDCVRPPDSDLLRMLAQAGPSKFLISSRLMPSALLNNSGVERPGVIHKMLTGLDASDAVAMLRPLGVSGDASTIGRYLDKNFGCHPLVVGVVGGLIRNYPSAPGNFDRWVEDPSAGGSVNVAEMDLVQRRNHILQVAFNDLTSDEHVLLSRIALISEAVEYKTLVVLNPRRPDLLEKVVLPPKRWRNAEDKELKERYQKELAEYQEYVQKQAAWQEMTVEAEKWLRRSLENLKSRGLLQWDREHAHYDLHPVVRGYVVNSIAPDQRPGVAQKVVDYFSSRPDLWYDTATSINEIRDPLQVVRTLLYIGKVKQATSILLRLVDALFWNMEAYAEYLALVQPLFPNGWTRVPSGLNQRELSRLWTYLAIGLEYTKSTADADSIYQHVVNLDIDLDESIGLLTDLRNFSMFRADFGWLRSADRINNLLFAATTLLGDEESKALERLWQFRFSIQCGNWVNARKCWNEFQSLPRPTTRRIYRPGNAEFYQALFCFYQNCLDEKLLQGVEHLTQQGNNRLRLRDVYRLKGEWKMSLDQWTEAAGAFEDEIRMSREVNLDSSGSEARLALVQVQIGQGQAAKETADRLALLEIPPNLELAELWLALEDYAKARDHVIPAYKAAWADGPPYAYWWDLQRCRKVLERLGDREPQLPPLDHTNEETFSFETKLLAYLERKRAYYQKQPRGQKKRRKWK